MMRSYSLSLAVALVVSQAAAFAGDSVTGKWVGNMSGNDPHIGAVFELKQSGNNIKGTFIWVSDSSGNCKRKVEGTYDPKSRVCKLHDTEIISYHPNEDWKFCLIDDYELSLSQDAKELTGKYNSKQCHDNASIKLRKMDR